MRLVVGDIADQDTDAVVTAAHWRLNKGEDTAYTVFARALEQLLSERATGWTG